MLVGGAAKSFQSQTEVERSEQDQMHFLRRRHAFQRCGVEVRLFNLLIICLLIINRL